MSHVHRNVDSGGTARVVDAPYSARTPPAPSCKTAGSGSEVSSACHVSEPTCASPAPWTSPETRGDLRTCAPAASRKMAMRNPQALGAQQSVNVWPSSTELVGDSLC